jgi:bifunctional oligoribonuclease and PAP phosphatase NrnA
MDQAHDVFGYEQLHAAFLRAGRILLVAHKKPDGDTIGASSAFLNWCLREGKEVNIFCRDLPPETFKYLDNIHRYTNDPAVFDAAYDLVIVFDSGDLAYCGVDQYIPRIPGEYLLVNIDHHNTNMRYATLNIVETHSSSTAEVIHRMWEALGVEVDHKMATCLLTGMCTDTGNFSNAATQPVVMEAAGSLIASGARFQDILKHVWHNQKIDGLRVWGTMLRRLRHHPEQGAVTTFVRHSELPESAEVTEGMSNFLNAVTKDAEVILVLRELPTGEVKGSFRSLTRDVSAVAKLMGGGGHKKAAGFTLQGHIEETEQGPVVVGETTTTLPWMLIPDLIS